MSKAKYICVEGTEGVGKGLQTERLVQYLESRGKKVLLTKEPGTPHLPITLQLRGIMLNSKYEKVENQIELISELKAISKSDELTDTAKNFLLEAIRSIESNKAIMLINREENYNPMTVLAREYVSQSIRSVHLENLISRQMDNYDFIIQDRGLLSGIAYGESCGNELSHLINLAETVVKNSNIREHGLIQKLLIKVGMLREFSDLYDYVIYLNGNAKKGLETAKNAKQEFTEGDAMEARGNSFMEKTERNFKNFMSMFNSVRTINVHETTSGNIQFRDKDVIFKEILQSIGEE